MKTIDDDLLSVLNQQGTNQKQTYQLSEIILNIEVSEPVTITHVFYTVNQFVEVNQTIELEKDLVISIPDLAYLYKETTLKIIYTHEGISYEKTIPTFRYFDRMTRSLDDEGINRIYTLN